jgi:site-specific DNA recombinase
MSSKSTLIRCAIYTRKSSDDGLEQAFNSLDAQFEACAAYIASQKHEGWKMLASRYDDGGVSGGTLERPALQRLLAAIDAGQVDMVIVYKIDRLTRSLADFARLVDRLDARGCSFVSVTQAFNTSTSMGRLTLNVLLSFAQFEREVTAERIRDKIAASKKKGLWMGGVPPLGYQPHSDPKQRCLMVQVEEAATVLQIFTFYDQLGCLSQVENAARAAGLQSKHHRFSTGRTKGGGPLSRGQIHYILTNPIYRGQIRHKDLLYEGLHLPIIDQDLWDRVQARLVQARARPRGRSASRTTSQGSLSQASDTGPLIGKLRDETGDLLTPTHTQRHGKRYRYYVSNRLLAHGPDPAAWRLPARDLEVTVAEIIRHHLSTASQGHQILRHPDASQAKTLAVQTDRILVSLASSNPAPACALLLTGTLARGQISLTLSAEPLAALLGLAPEALAPDLLHITAPFGQKRRGIETKLISGALAPTPDPTLARMLTTAHRWCRDIRAGRGVMDLARLEAHSDSYIRTRIALAFLSPRIQAAILAGTQPADLTLERLVRTGIPLDWTEQEARFGFA